MKRIFAATFAVLFCATTLTSSQVVKIASGAGYKQPVMRVINHLKDSGASIEPIFGNLKQVCSQAMAGNFDVVIGDLDFLKNSCGVEFVRFHTLGKGILVLVSAKELKSVDEIVSLNKIAMPQSGKAIYGIRAKQFLQNSKLGDKLGDKLIEVATVPQVSAYIFSGDVDAGFVNLTEAIVQGDKFKTVIKIDETMYETVQIVAGELENCKQNSKCIDFIGDLTSPEAKKIFADYGLE